MSLISSISAFNKTDYPQKTFEGGVALTQNMPNSVFGVECPRGTSGVSKNSDTEDSAKSKNLSEAEINKKVATKTKAFIERYNCYNQLGKVENIEKNMKFSRNSKLLSVPSILKITIKSLNDEILKDIESFSLKTADCKTQEEVDKLTKEFEEVLQQKKHKAMVYAQRAQKAAELDRKLSSVASDPKKAKLTDNINIDKVIEKLTGPVEDIELSQKTDGENKADSSKDPQKYEEASEKALQDDEISKVVDSLIKYVDGGEKDKNLDEYLNKGKDNNTEQNMINPFGQKTTMAFNPFSTDSDDDKRKNPFI